VNYAGDIVNILLFVTMQGYIVNTVQMTFYINWPHDFIMRVRLDPALLYWSLKTLPSTHPFWQGRMDRGHKRETNRRITNSLSSFDKFLAMTVTNNLSNLINCLAWPKTCICLALLTCIWTLAYLRRSCFNMKLVVVYIVYYVVSLWTYRCSPRLDQDST